MILMHLKTSFAYIRRSPFQALAAVSILALTFFVATLISVLVYSSNQVLHDFETRPQIIAFIKKDASEDSIDTLENKLRGDFRVRDVKFVSKEEAVDIYKSATSDNPLLGELVSPSIFPASLEFSATDLQFAENVIDEVKKEEIIESVGFTASVGGQSDLSDVLNRLKTITNYVRIGGISAVGVLAVTSFLVLMVVVGMRIQTRKTEIETLSLIGATKGFIRTPIVFEAIQYALFGSLIGWLLGIVVVLYATPSILGYFGSIPVLPHDSVEFFILLGLILIGELIISLIIALAGSLLAVTRAFK